MGQRVNITQAARITGRSEKTIRTWLQWHPPPLTIVYGPCHGGRRSAETGAVTKGRTRWMDLDELRRLHEAQGGTEWHTEHVPGAKESDYAHELEELRGRLIWMERARAQISATRAWEAGSPEELQVLGTPREQGAPLDLERCTPEQRQAVRQLVAVMVAGNTPAQTHSKPPEDSDAPGAGEARSGA